MTSKFKVGDKVVFDELNKGVAKEFGYYPNKSYEVINVFPNEETIQIINENGLKNAFAEYRFNLIDNKPSKNQRITALEETVALQEVKIVDLRNDYRYEVEQQQKEINELKSIVAQIRKPSAVVEEALTAAASSVEDIIEFEGAQYKKVDREAREGDVAILREPAEQTPYVKNDMPYKVVRGYNGKPYLISSTAAYLYDGHFGCTSETVDVYELIVEDNPYPPFVIPEPAPVKSPNQKRAEIIEKAKMFVEKQFDAYSRVRLFAKGSVRYCTPEWVVNEEKRTIAVLLIGYESADIWTQGIAKCMPDDVFNEHIGKAIALGRALKLDVSEFEQAVQPNELVIGMEVKLHGNPTGLDFFGIDTFDEVQKLKNGDYSLSKNGKGLVDGRGRYSLYKPQFDSIINDTNAIYGGGE